MNKWINVWTNRYMDWGINKQTEFNNKLLKSEECFSYNVVYVGAEKEMYIMHILLVALTTEK